MILSSKTGPINAEGVVDVVVAVEVAVTEAEGFRTVIGVAGVAQ